MWLYLDYLDHIGEYKKADKIFQKIASNNPSEILGLYPPFTKSELLDKYRDLVKKYHPDVNNDPDASEKFRQIHEAYKLLSSFQENISINPFLRFFNSPDFIEFYNSDALSYYYRTQVGLIKNKQDKEKAKLGVNWFRNELSRIIDEIIEDNSEIDSISEQNILNIFSESRYKNKELNIPIRIFTEYFKSIQQP